MQIFEPFYVLYYIVVLYCVIVLLYLKSNRNPVDQNQLKMLRNAMI